MSNTEREEARNMAGGFWLVAVVLFAAGGVVVSGPVAALFVVGAGLTVAALYKSIQGM